MMHNSRLGETYWDEMTCNGMDVRPNYTRIANIIIYDADVNICEFLAENDSLSGLKVKGIGKETKQVLEWIILGDHSELAEFRRKKGDAEQMKLFWRLNAGLMRAREIIPGATCGISVMLSTGPIHVDPPVFRK